MGISIVYKTSMKETVKLINHINSYLFEQEFDEAPKLGSKAYKLLKEVSIELQKVIK